MNNLNEENIQKIILHIKQILINIYAKYPPIKKEIIRYENSLNFACPYCRDSHNNHAKKRGFLYLDTLLYQCYNEGCHSNLIKLYKDFSISISPDELLSFNQIKNDYQNKIKKSQSSLELSTDNFFHLDWLLNLCENNNSLKLTNIININKNSFTSNYLNERKIYNRKGLLEATYNNKEKVILIFNNYNSYFISLQIRNLKSGKYRFFKNISYNKLYEIFSNKFETKLESDQINAYTKLSNYYNLLKVNFDKPVYITEGWFDSSFINNSLSLNGLNKDTDLLEEFGHELYYIFDFDKPGLNKAKKYVKNNKKVFLWRKFLKNYNLSLYKKWDINDIAITDINLINDIPNYFSKNQFDLMYI